MKLSKAETTSRNWIRSLHFWDGTMKVKNVGQIIKEGEIAIKVEPKSKITKFLIWLKILKPWVIKYNNQDTSSFKVGDKLYIDPKIPGAFTKKTDPADSGNINK